MKKCQYSHLQVMINTKLRYSRNVSSKRVRGCLESYKKCLIITASVDLTTTSSLVVQEDNELMHATWVKIKFRLLLRLREYTRACKILPTLDCDVTCIESIYVPAVTCGHFIFFERKSYREKNRRRLESALATGRLRP